MREFQFFILALCLQFSGVGMAQTDYESFIGEKIPIYQDQLIENSFFHEYDLFKTKIKKYTDNKNIPKNAIAGIYIKSNTPDSLIKPIQLVHKLTFTHKNVKTCIVKFYEENHDKSRKFSSIILQNINEEWQNSSIPEIEDIRFVVKILQTEPFWQFYNKSNDPKFPEINQLKIQVKDQKGFLNIDKLAEVLQANKNQLSKYLDE